MASPDWKLSVLTFPQRWNGSTAELHLRVALLPRTNPLESFLKRTPPDPDEPAFVKASLSFEALLIPSLERLPDPGDVKARRPLNATSPSNLDVLYQALANAFPITAPGGVTSKAEPRRKDTYVKKFLPVSYRSAFAFEQPRTQFAYVDDTYQCALQTPPKAPPAQPPSAGMSWGQVIASVLQQPRLAERLGLVYAGKIKVPSPTFLENGGWVFVALTSGSTYASLAPPGGNHVKYYAARLPMLPQGSIRPLFGAVLFPVLSGPPSSSYDENFSEAEAYDDGFTKIVHCEQPTKADFLDTSTDAMAPVQDAGIQLGWDDEQLTIWMNRQIDPALEAQDSPMSVLGYLVDVRKPATTAWRSLSRVKGDLRLGTVLNEVFEGEHGFRVAPNQLHGRRTGDFWLPSYFARWTGKSLVARDDFVGRLTNGTTRPPAFEPVGLDAVPLQYGKSYEFRVRLMDIAGGGPDVTDDPVNAAPAPIAMCEFRRFVPPKSVRVVGAPAPPDPDNPETLYKILRPVLGYPSLVFTGFPNAEAALVADVAAAAADGREVGVPDPDVVTLEIGIEVRDPALPVEGSFHTVGVTTREFPAVPPDALQLEVLFRDVKDIGTLSAQPQTGPLTLPTARDLRLRLTPICRPDPGLQYFGSQEARRGMPIYVSTRANSSDERGLFVHQTPGHRLQAILLQPGPVPNGNLAATNAVGGKQQEAPADPAQRLAQQLQLDLDGLTLFGKPGRRIVYGCSTGLRHVLAPDHSSITFASSGELTHHWIAVLKLQIDRDWTWDALAEVSFEVRREVKRLLTGEIEKDVVGTIEVRRSVSRTALKNPDMNTSDLFFFDAIDPKPATGEFPSELEVTYTVQASFKKAPGDRDPALSVNMRLPMAVPPSQTPKLVSAGLALSPYVRADDYSSSEPRQRMLWLEFEEPVADQRDAYFAHVLAYAADPMLTGEAPVVPPAPVEPALPVDPEQTLVITPGQSDDRAGLDAMQALIPSTSPRHFLLPLPPGLSEQSSELFGFFVYEIRVGHAKGWSTAQGRFGPPLRATGVQHPAPPLACQVRRQPARIIVSSAYAAPVFENHNLLPRSPRTEIWGLLYAQVTQIDGAGRRNVLLGRKRASPTRQADVRETTDLIAVVQWDQSEVEMMLRALALRRDSPLSVLAVELLPELERKVDPLGGDLGQVRILRTSPLTPVPRICV